MIIDKGDKMALVTKSGQTVNVRFEVNPKARRRLILRLDERKREAVAVAPSKRKIGEAAAFARDRIDWIAEHLQALPDNVCCSQALSLCCGESLARSRLGRDRANTEDLEVEPRTDPPRSWRCRNDWKTC